MYYVHGSTPVGALCASETFTRTYENIDDETGETEEIPYDVTEWITLLSSDDIINLFIREMNNTEVLIKNSEFLLRYPIITTGIAKVRLDNCIAHLEGSGAGFVQVNNSQGSVISNNSMSPSPYNKYGSRHSREYWPANTEFHLKINKMDQVIDSYTDKRGYIPTSCGPVNKDKNVTIIIRDAVTI